jgi:hypothetical protein
MLAAHDCLPSRLINFKIGMWMSRNPDIGKAVETNSILTFMAVISDINALFALITRPWIPRSTYECWLRNHSNKEWPMRRDVFSSAAVTENDKTVPTLVICDSVRYSYKNEPCTTEVLGLSYHIYTNCTHWGTQLAHFYCSGG